MTNAFPLPLEEAQQRVWNSIRTTETVWVPLDEAEGHVLAEDVIADADVPPFDKAMLDGYAVLAEDVRAASPTHPVRLQVIESVQAGSLPVRRVTTGTAIRIMTGAPVPVGANAVCRLEMTRGGEEGKWVEVLAPVSEGEAIDRVGEDVRKGTTILSKGIRIGPAEAGLLATFGRGRVPVHRKPVVAILSSGTELVEAGEPLQPGRIRDSNSYMLASQVIRCGGVPKRFPVVRDDVEAIARTIAAALEEADLVVTTGGVSVGDSDHMHEAYARAGAERVFWRVLIRPGSPVLFAVKGEVPLLGLSGNPAAAFVNAELFLLPAVRKMAGERAFQRPLLLARLSTAPAKKAIKPARFLRGRAFVQNGTLFVDTSRSQSSGILSSFLGSNCLVRIEGGQLPQAGDPVPILLYGEIGDRL